MQPLDRDAECEHVIHDRVEELPVLVHAQERIAEHARRQPLGAYTLLGSPALRRFRKVEPLELHPRHHGKAHLPGTREHALERLPGTLGMRRSVRVDELAEEEWHVVVPRHASQKPKPPAGYGSAAPRNLSRCKYLPRKMPSMSLTATLILVASDFCTAAIAGWILPGAFRVAICILPYA